MVSILTYVRSCRRTWSNAWATLIATRSRFTTTEPPVLAVRALSNGDHFDDVFNGFEVVGTTGVERKLCCGRSRRNQ